MHLLQKAVRSGHRNVGRAAPLILLVTHAVIQFRIADGRADGTDYMAGVYA